MGQEDWTSFGYVALPMVDHCISLFLRGYSSSRSDTLEDFSLCECALFISCSYICLFAFLYIRKC
jgi:hypothetical protein